MMRNFACCGAVSLGMRPPNTVQKGAFFGVVAVALIVALTVMAMKAADQAPEPHLGRLHHHQVADGAPATTPDGAG